MARIVRIHETGGPEVLRVEDIPVRAPGPGEIRIHVEAMGINRSDVIFRYGHHPVKPQFPSLLGSEAAGTVEAIGEGVQGFSVGEAVSVIPRMAPEHGTCGEIINVPARFVTRHPAPLSMIEAAGLWSPFLTAYGGLVTTGGLASGDLVILPAASSSVGLAAIQIAIQRGAIPVATTRLPHKKQRLLDAGAHDVIVTQEEDLAARLAEITAGRHAQVIFDPVGGPDVETFAEVMGEGGAYVLYGVLSGQFTPFPVATAFARQLTMRTFALDAARQQLEESISTIVTGVENGVFRPTIDRVFPIEQIVEAHRYMESNQQFGKIVVTTS